MGREWQKNKQNRRGTAGEGKSIDLEIVGF